MEEQARVCGISKDGNKIYGDWVNKSDAVSAVKQNNERETSRLGWLAIQTRKQYEEDLAYSQREAELQQCSEVA